MHDVDVAETDHDAWSNQDVAGQEMEVEYPLPIGGISVTLALKFLHSVQVREVRLDGECRIKVGVEVRVACFQRGVKGQPKGSNIYLV